MATRHRPSFLLEFSDEGSTLWDYVVENDGVLSSHTVRGRDRRATTQVLIDEFIEAEGYDYSLVLEYAQLLENWNESIGSKYQNISKVVEMIVSEVQSALADRY